MKNLFKTIHSIRKQIILQLNSIQDAKIITYNFNPLAKTIYNLVINKINNSKQKVLTNVKANNKDSDKIYKTDKAPPPQEKKFSLNLKTNMKLYVKYTSRVDFQR